MNIENEIREIELTLNDYSEYIIAHFDKEIPKRESEIVALVYLICENDDFIRWIDAYYELHCTMVELLDELELME